MVCACCIRLPVCVVDLPQCWTTENTLNCLKWLEALELKIWDIWHITESGERVACVRDYLMLPFNLAVLCSVGWVVVIGKVFVGRKLSENEASVQLMVSKIHLWYNLGVLVALWIFFSVDYIYTTHFIQKPLFYHVSIPFAC